MLNAFSSSSASVRPIVGNAAAKVYGLLFIALAITLVGVVAGVTFALPILSSGWVFFLLLIELVIIWTARAWSHRTPLNYVLFATFPFISGLTLAPIILSVLLNYGNGEVILLNALIATALMTASAAVLATMTKGDLGGMMGRFLLQSLLGLIVFGILQLFFPALRGPGFEMIISGVGIVTFSLFLAYDIQRLSRRADLDSPFLLALSLYLDVFNLFLYVLRFMLAMSGRRQ